MDKKKLVADMYALRAGLSYIVLEGQKMESETSAAEEMRDKEIRCANEELQKKQEQLENFKSQVRRVEQEKENKIESSREKINNLDGEISYIRNNYDVDVAREHWEYLANHQKRFEEGYNLRRQIIILTLQLILVIFNLFAILFIVDSNTLRIILIVIEICGVVWIFSYVVAYFIGVCKRYHEAISHPENNQALQDRSKRIEAWDKYNDILNQHRTGESEVKIRELEEEKKAIEKSLVTGEVTAFCDDKLRTIRALIKQESDICFAASDAANTMIQQANEKCAVKCIEARRHKDNAVATYNALVDNYAAMLDPRDWENVDMIIYNIETNRADSIKEALLLVDTAKRNNAIIEAVNSAGRAIGQTIRNEMMYTRSGIYAGLSELSHRISSYASNVSELSGVISRQSETLTAINSGIGQIVDQSALQSALTEKANTTSLELVSNVKKLVKLEEKRK